MVVRCNSMVYKKKPFAINKLFVVKTTSIEKNNKFFKPPITLSLFILTSGTNIIILESHVQTGSITTF